MMKLPLLLLQRISFTSLFCNSSEMSPNKAKTYLVEVIDCNKLVCIRVSIDTVLDGHRTDCLLMCVDRTSVNVVDGPQFGQRRGGVSGQGPPCVSVSGGSGVEPDV